jgi:uncharacterized protein (DUF1697 family)
MKALKALLEGLGLSDVRTYLQSGNVVFKADKDPTRKALEDAIEGEFGVDVTVLLRTHADLAAVVEGNPFLGAGADRSRLYVTFLAEAPAPDALADVDTAKFAPDVFQLAGRELYLHFPNGYGRTKLSNDFFERRLRLRATTRNWNTVTKLLELSG